jgi:hypothetical protein
MATGFGPEMIEAHVVGVEFFLAGIHAATHKQLLNRYHVETIVLLENQYYYTQLRILPLRTFLTMWIALANRLHGCVC